MMEKNLRKQKYFDPTYAKKDRSFDETVKLIGETIQDSVDYHQIADVEVGSFLSGGVDSSYIASTVKPMKTYSVGLKSADSMRQPSPRICAISFI